VIPTAVPSLFVPYSMTRGDIRIDRVVLGFTAALSLATAFVFGVTPALEASRLELAESLKTAGGGGTAGSRRQSRMRTSLVVAEVALSVMLLVGAGLLVRTFMHLQRVDLGFRPDNVLSFDVSLPASKYPAAPQAAAFFDQTIERLRGLGGVTAAGASEFLPLSGADSATPFFVDGRPKPAPGDEQKAHYRSVTPGYFGAMGISLVRGRLLTDRDGAAGARVALVNETMARQYWAGRNPIGQRMAITLEALRFRPDGPPTLDIPSGMREIVGIVGDVRHNSVQTDPLPEVYMPFAQRPMRTMTVVLRTDADPLAVARDARHVVSAIDPDQPIANVNTVSALVSASIAQPRFNVLLLSAFAAVAMILAVVGVYGVMSYSVALRTREIGVRIALGGQASDIAGLIVRQGMRVALTGLAIGLVSALALGRVMTGLLFGVTATDPLTFAAAGVVLAAVALAACYLPARRAMRIDPVTALRNE
jgi:putative ABC transport system permease protein